MTYSTNEISLIVNQDSGKVPSKMRVLSRLSKQHKLKLKMSDGSDIDSVIRETLKNKKLKRLIIGGGDGTISLAASLVRRINPKVEIAVLPLGTANYYARSLGLQRSLTQAFNVATNGEVEQRHLCRVNKRDFLIGVNVGATSQMFSEVTDDDKKRFGKIAYFKGIFKVLLTVSPTDLTVKVNGKKNEFNSTELVVLNQYIDEPVKLTPEVKGTEPYFEIVTYGLGKSKLSPLFGVVIFAITFGKNQKYLKRIKATKAVISSRKQQPVAVDGDSLERLPLKIELIKKPVKFIIA
jgi:YegS/Rv2252/BmrU family lipid kinase